MATCTYLVQQICEQASIVLVFRLAFLPFVGAMKTLVLRGTYVQYCVKKVCE